jgi:biotin carboxyl carrier protein
VENIFVKVGDAVKVGIPLVSVRSPDVSDAYSNYLSNLSQVKQAERICNLNRQLFEIGAVTKNDLLASEANCEQLKALSQALKRKLEIYGVNSDSGFSDRLTIKSPMDGAVVEVPAAPERVVGHLEHVHRSQGVEGGLHLLGREKSFVVERHEEERGIEGVGSYDRGFKRQACTPAHG